MRSLIRVLLIGRAALHLLLSTDLAWPSISGLPSTDEFLLRSARLTQIHPQTACSQICLTNKYLPNDRQGTSACQDSGKDPADEMIRVLLMDGAALHPLRTVPCAAISRVSAPSY